MYFMHADPIWEAHPNLHAFTLVIDHVLDIKETTALSDPLIPRIEQRLASQTESEMPEISAWRAAFSKMGFKPTQYRCASEALLRRYRKEKSMPTLHPLIDYLNYVSMTFAIPIAAFDCGKIFDGILVRPAEGSELYQPFQGDIEHPLVGETIFADPAGNAHSRRWTYRQSAQSVVSKNTDRVLIVAEALHAEAERDLISHEEELRSGLGAAGLEITASTRINIQERRFDF